MAHDDRHRGALRSPHRNREIRLTYPQTYTARYARLTRLATLAACLRTPPSGSRQFLHKPPPPPRSGRVAINPTGQADSKGVQSPPKPSASPSSGRAVGAGCRQPQIIYRLTPSGDGARFARHHPPRAPASSARAKALRHQPVSPSGLRLAR